MSLRHRSVTHLLAAVFAIAAGAATLTGQQKWQTPRTPDGHPDFQGVWANNTVTPLQRPKQWEGKTRLSEAEIAELQRFAAQITEKDGEAPLVHGFILD